MPYMDGLGLVKDVRNKLPIVHKILPKQLK